jgi:hypothetical protein
MNGTGRKAHTGQNEQDRKDKLARTGQIKQKKFIFRFCQKILQATDEVKKCFANFQILRPLGCQGWAVMPKNGEKGKINAP